MSKWFCVALLVSAALVGTLRAGPSPCFVVGPITFSNCQVSNTTSPGLSPMSFSPVAGTFNVPPGSFAAEVMIPGSYVLNADVVPQAVSETFSADFSIVGYTLSSLSARGQADDTGIHVSENIFITSPCMATIPGGGGFQNTGCIQPLPAGMQSGSLVVKLDIHSTACTSGGPGCDTGVVGSLDINLLLQPIPEPSMFGLLFFSSLVVAARAALRGYR